MQHGMGPRGDASEAAVEGVGDPADESAAGYGEGKVEQSEGPPPYHEGQQQGEHGQHEEVGDEEVEGEGAEVVEREGEGAELGYDGEEGDAEGIADEPGEVVAGKELLDVGPCGEDGGHGHVGELEAYIEEVEGVYEEHGEGGEGEDVERGAVGTDPAGYDVEGAHEDGADDGGRHAYEEGKEPQEGDGGELGQRMQAAAVAEAAEGEGEEGVDDAYVEAREGEGVGGAGTGVVGAGIGAEPLLVAECEGGEDAEFVALEEGLEVAGLQVVAQAGEAQAQREGWLHLDPMAVAGVEVGGAGEALLLEVAAIVEVVVGSVVAGSIDAGCEVEEVAGAQGGGEGGIGIGEDAALHGYISGVGSGEGDEQGAPGGASLAAGGIDEVCLVGGGMGWPGVVARAELEGVAGGAERGEEPHGAEGVEEGACLALEEVGGKEEEQGGGNGGTTPPYEYIGRERKGMGQKDAGDVA